MIYDNSLHQRGEKHYKAKLTNQQVYSIKRILAQNLLTHQHIADIFLASRETITRINNQRAWKHIIYP